MAGSAENDTRCQPRYLAIETAVMLGLVFGLRLRQTEGLLGSVLQLMGLNCAGYIANYGISNATSVHWASQSCSTGHLLYSLHWAAEGNATR